MEVFKDLEEIKLNCLRCKTTIHLHELCRHTCDPADIYFYATSRNLDLVLHNAVLYSHRTIMNSLFEFNVSFPEPRLTTKGTVTQRFYQFEGNLENRKPTNWQLMPIFIFIYSSWNYPGRYYSGPTSPRHISSDYSEKIAARYASGKWIWIHYQFQTLDSSPY